ncbi:sporulation integral membrane protein YtvI [Alteribacillus sp. HJP-4]|uniref:sporulation integral membrane protein YtvI n=1 Tax=Alteribacillus sp. HJP-4 TaxID=2775394 RepID=UPI0035CD17F2
MKKETGWMLLRFVLVVVAAIVIVWSIIKIFSFTYPFWIAAFFAWCLKPLSSFFQKKLRLPAGLAALTALLIGIAVFGGVIAALVYLIIDSIQRFSERAPELMEKAFSDIQEFLDRTITPFFREASGVAEDIGEGEDFSVNDGLSEIGAQLGTAISQVAQWAADGLTHLVISVPTFLVAFLFILIAIYFIGKDWDRMTAGAKAHIPTSVQDKIHRFHRAMWVRVFGYVKAQFILMTVTGIIVFTGLTILQIQGALLLSIIVGVAEFLPYLGTGTILIPWGIFQMVTGNIVLGLSLIILYIITMIIRQTIEPKVLSSSMNLNPLAVLISLFAGLKLFGAAGLFFGPAFLVLVVILIDIGVIEDLRKFIRYGFT